MKRIIIITVSFLLMLMGGIAHAKTAKLSLGAISGNTTVASGTSTFIVDMASGTTVIGVDNTEGYFSIQVNNITVAKGSESTPSGATFTVTYKASNYDTPAHWAAEATTTVINGVALSGNSRYIYEIYPKFCRYLQFYFGTGITKFYDADVILTYR